MLAEYQPTIKSLQFNLNICDELDFQKCLGKRAFA